MISGFLTKEVLARFIALHSNQFGRGRILAWLEIKFALVRDGRKLDASLLLVSEGQYSLPKD